MTWVLGEVVSESFDVGTTGQTLSRTASYINGSVSVWNPTFTELGGGFYRYSYTPLVSGSFEWTGTSTNLTPVSINFDVEASAPTVTILGTAGVGGLTQTLAQLRRRVARRLGDYKQLTTTANGTTATLIDTIRVNTATEDMKGRWVVPSNGSNAGIARPVTAQVDATGTLTVTPVWAQATAADDTFDVYNKRSKGFEPVEYDAAINDAINDAFPLGVIEIAATISPDFDATTGLVTIPAAFTHISALEWTDAEGFLTVLPKATNTNQWGWIVDAASGELRLLGWPAGAADGMALKITGFGRQATLTSDSDTCALNAEYIVSRACYHLCMGGMDKDPVYGQWVGVYLQESNRLRTRVRTLNKGEMVRAA